MSAAIRMPSSSDFQVSSSSRESAGTYGLGSSFIREPPGSRDGASKRRPILLRLPGGAPAAGTPVPAGDARFAPRPGDRMRGDLGRAFLGSRALRRVESLV